MSKDTEIPLLPPHLGYEAKLGVPAQPNISLRDYIANTALSALMFGKAPLDVGGKKIPKTPTNLSLLAYEYATAMLIAREAGE